MPKPILKLANLRRWLAVPPFLVLLAIVVWRVLDLLDTSRSIPDSARSVWRFISTPLGQIVLIIIALAWLFYLGLRKPPQPKPSVDSLNESIAALQEKVAVLEGKMSQVYVPAPSVRISILSAQCADNKIEVHVKVDTNIYVGVIKNVMLRISGRDLTPIAWSEWDADAETTRLVEFGRPSWLTRGKYEATLTATHLTLSRLQSSLFRIDVP